MYPRARTKGGLQGGRQGDVESAGGTAQPTVLPLAPDAVVSSNTTAGHSEPPNSILYNPGSHYSSLACDQRHNAHATQKQLPPPPPPMLHMSGVYCKRMQDICVSLPPPPPPHFFAGNMQHHSGNACGGMHHRTMSSSYDQQPRPVPLPHVNCYQGDTIACTSACATISGAMQAGFPASVASPGTITQVPFSQHSRTSSTCVTWPPTGIAGSGDAACRPPPIYGEKDLDSSAGAAASAITDFSVVPLNHQTTPASGCLAHTAKATCTTPLSMGILDGGNSTLSVIAPPLPSSTSAGVPILQMRATGSSCLAAASESAAIPGVTSPKTTVHGGASLVAASGPLSPLVNSPSCVRQQSPQPHLQVPQQRSAEPSKRPRRPPSDARKDGGASSRGDIPAPVRGVDIADTDSNEGRGSSYGKAPTKPTIAQAEARCRYLYEEFRKFSRLRVKLVEENESVKREKALLRDELEYYRRKTASAAQEREALLADYRDDLHNALCLAQALAADAAAAAACCSGGNASRSASPTEGSGHNVPVSSPQEALEAAMARISASNAVVAATAPTSLPSTGVPAPPSLPQKAVGWSASPLSRIAEHLGLRYGRWMPMPAAAPRTLIVRKEPRNPSLRQRQRSGTGPQHIQSVLLRDEMRDVHWATHAAMSAYMTSLDYGFAPVFSQRSYPPGDSQKSPHQQHHFSSEYCGLHFHVDVPQLHAHRVSGVLNPADTDENDAGRQNTLVHGAFLQSSPEELQLLPDLAP